MVRYCHLYNRGVDKRTIFSDYADRRRFVSALRLARLSNSPSLSLLKKQVRIGSISSSELEKLEEKFGPPLLDIISYALMPNHFHFQVKELIDKGVSKFFRKLGTSYVMYFNIKHERTGRLFESQYKSVSVSTDEQLLHLSRYIHANPFNSSRVKISLQQLKFYPWTSLPDYLGTRKQPFCNPSEVMAFFKSSEDYWNFLTGGVDKKEVLSSDLLLDSG